MQLLLLNILPASFPVTYYSNNTVDVERLLNYFDENFQGQLSSMQILEKLEHGQAALILAN